MTPSRLRKLTTLTSGAAILSIGVSGCAKSEPIVNAPEAQSSATTASTDTAPLAPRVVLNAPPQIPSTDDAGAPVNRLNTSDGGKRPPFLNAPPHAPPRLPPGSSAP